ncbi:hypothetical protein Tco_0027112 [Tanacetum coccineum]
MQRQEEKVNMREAVNAGLVVTESSGIKPEKYDRQREIIPALNQQDEMNRFLHCSEHYRWKGKPSGLLRSTEDVEESNLPHFLDISRTQTR